MSMLKRANKMAFAKVGIYGTAGAGKSRTAAEIAIGLCLRTGDKRPIGIFDTEPAWSWLLPLIAKAGLPEPFVYDESRAFKDLMAWTQEAEKECSVLIVDSITHIWRDLQESFLARLNDQRKQYSKRPLTSLEFQHWGPIKRTWGEFTDHFIASKVHFIVCGRAGSVYEYQDKDDGSGKKELITVGTKMATEKELGYEPSLLIEMVQDREDGRIINTGIIQKDRADKINGKVIAFPNFEKLQAHFDALNIGGSHIESMTKRDSREMFTETGEDTWGAELRRKEVALDEIKEEILRHLGHGMDAGTKAAKAQLLEDIAGTRSWAKLESMRLVEVQKIRNDLWIKTRGHQYGEEPPAEKLDDEVPVDPKKEDAA